MPARDDFQKVQTEFHTTPDELDDCECVHPAAVTQGRQKIGAAVGIEEMATLFATLGDPTRLRVLTALSECELCVSDLAAATNVNRTTISHQLRVLRANRLVRRRRDGKVAYYRLDDHHVERLLHLATVHVSEQGAHPSQATA